MLHTVTTLQDLRLATAGWHQRRETVGFVPTMGALHDGHKELVRQSQNLTTRTVVSIFVNPMQFGPNEDFGKYPRQLEEDKKKLEDMGCDVLFAPSLDEMFPPTFATKINPGPLATILEGAIRPHHFAGVATVVTKLLLQVMPDYAFFGEKDFQQLRILENLVQDLAIPTHIIPIPIVRDKDGLALSSRNAFLSAAERAWAIVLPQTLTAIAEKLRLGDKIESTLQEGRARLTEVGFAVDYLILADAKTLEPLTTPKPNARLLAAARLGTTRLLDNLLVFEDEEDEK